MCRDLSEIATYARVDNAQYRLLKASTPGSYTFILEGTRELPRRVLHPKRKTIGVLTPYFPYPLSHGGAVRMFNLLREIGREFNLVLYAFTEAPIAEEDFAPVLEFTSRVYLVEKPRYREPRWSTVKPPEVCEYWSPAMAKLIASRSVDLLQTEYTYLAQYGGDILVEHDVTYDLYKQVLAREATLSAWWDLWRWKRFETAAVSRFRQVVVMSDKDREMLGVPHSRVIENGVEAATVQEYAVKSGLIKAGQNAEQDWPLAKVPTTKDDFDKALQAIKDFANGDFIP